MLSRYRKLNGVMPLYECGITNLEPKVTDRVDAVDEVGASE